MFRRLLALALVSCAATHTAAPPPVKPSVPLYEGLGSHTRKITTRSREAQRYFDQGLDFTFGFNHAEAIRAFAYAAVLDPQCAMAEWGVALANGPHINDPIVDDAHAKAAVDAIGRARALRAGASPVEAALIDALATRYQFPQPADRKPLDAAYAAAMRDVWRAHPNDADVGALFAEALMDLHPWETWSREGKPLFDTPEVLTTLDAALAIDPKHPLANHLTIHALEASPAPERADRAADIMRTLQPALGHMMHMPSHVDVRRGRWEEAVIANEKAILADRAYVARGASPSTYWLYISHSHHMLIFASMMRGQSEKALAAARAQTALFTPEVLQDPKMVKMFDNVLTVPMEVLLRFGKWEDILALPARGDDYPFSETFRHYARGVALAAKGDVAGAREEQRTFTETAKRVTPDRQYRHDPASKIIAVADKLLDGEILFREGRQAEGIEAMREAVKREDALNYAEPPEWVHPVRHALGASLLRAKRYAEAESVYRDDLAKNLRNGWSLIGLARSLKAQGKPASEVEADFEKAWSAADTPLSSSCFCQPGE
jgi:tetratricopeptide (TPR) repeat protein